MKKRKNRQWLSVALFLLIGAASGILIACSMDRIEGKSIWTFFRFLLLAYLAMFLQIVIHESGHLVFGLMTGYQFSSFRIFSWMWLKENGRIRFRRLSVAGTGGQCLMIPPDLKDGRMPVLLYNFGGSIMNLAASAIFWALSLLFPDVSYLSVFLRLLVLVGIGFAVMNGLPVHMGAVDNDGCNALSMVRSREATRAFWVQMKMNEQLSKGIRIKDMPEEWFEVPGDDALENSMIATTGVFVCNRLMDEHRFMEADALMNHLLSVETGIPDLYRSLMICDRIYIEAITQNREDVLHEMLTKDLKKVMKAMKDYPSVLRTEYALALNADHDIEKAKKIREQFYRISGTYPYPVEIEGEAELMDIAEKNSRGQALC